MYNKCQNTKLNGSYRKALKTQTFYTKGIQLEESELLMGTCKCVSTEKCFL